MIALPGKAEAGRDFAIVLPRIAHGVALFGLTQRAPALCRLGLQILDLSGSSPTTYPLNPNFHI